MEIKDLPRGNITAKINKILPRISTGESADETSTGKAKIGETSKCAESRKTMMSRPPKLPRILRNVEDMKKKTLSQRAPRANSKKPEMGGRNGLYIGKNPKNPYFGL